MRTFILSIFFLISFSIYSQNYGNLLLIKTTTHRDLEIDKLSYNYTVLELDKDYKIIRGDFSKLVFFQDFTDAHIFSCIKKDSIKIKSFYNSETFEHQNKIGLKNGKIIEENSKKMHWLMDLKCKSLLYNQKIEIHYTLITADYCISSIAQPDAEMLGYNSGQIALILSELKVNLDYLIPKENLYEIIKAINFNNIVY
jgi:hypothetical protein